MAAAPPPRLGLDCRAQRRWDAAREMPAAAAAGGPFRQWWRCLAGVVLLVLLPRVRAGSRKSRAALRRDVQRQLQVGILLSLCIEYSLRRGAGTLAVRDALRPVGAGGGAGAVFCLLAATWAPSSSSLSAANKSFTVTFPAVGAPGLGGPCMALIVSGCAVDSLPEEDEQNGVFFDKQ